MDHRAHRAHRAESTTRAAETATTVVRTGPPVLAIRPATEVCEPVGFTTARGDDASSDAEQVRRGVADVRLEVFVGEQDVPLIQEVDAHDDAPTTIHVLARGADGTPLGAGRLLLEPDHPGRVHLGRLAVRRLARGTGLGAGLVAAIETAALENAGSLMSPGATGTGPDGPGVEVILSAQEQAMGFYERCGYRPVSGERYLDAGIWHQDMIRTVREIPSGATAQAPHGAERTR